MAVPTTNISMYDVYNEIHATSYEGEDWENEVSSFTLATLVADSNLADKTAPHDLNAFSGYTHTLPIPATPILLAAIWNEFSETVEFHWESGGSGTEASYNIVYENLDSTPDLHSKITFGTSYDATEYSCSLPSTLYWKVKATNATGSSAFTSIHSVSIGNCPH